MDEKLFRAGQSLGLLQAMAIVANHPDKNTTIVLEILQKLRQAETDVTKMITEMGGCE